MCSQYISFWLTSSNCTWIIIGWSHTAISFFLWIRNRKWSPPQNIGPYIFPAKIQISKPIDVPYIHVYVWFKGILSTSCVIFSYPKLLSISVLTFIKWRLTPSYVAKDTIFWQKRPKTIVIRIIVRMTIFKSIHMAFYANTSWACALFRNNKQHVVLGKRETVNAWKKADFDGFRDKEE